MRGILMALMAAVIFWTMPAQAQDKSAVDVIKDAVFKAAEAKAIEEYYKATGRKPADTEEADKSDDDDKDKSHKGKKDKGAKGKGKSGGLPPGLAKKGSLPPGLAKKGDQLPPGLAKRDLPEGLTEQLPPPPPGTERVEAGADVVLIETATGVVLDVLEGVIAGARQ